MNEILKDIYHSLKKGKVPDIPKVPHRPKGRKKGIELVSPRKKQVKFMMCKKMYEFLKFMCANSGVGVGPFVYKAVMRELVREIQEREEMISKMQQYYANYFECAEVPASDNDAKEEQDDDEDVADEDTAVAA